MKFIFIVSDCKGNKNIMNKKIVFFSLLIFLCIIGCENRNKLVNSNLLININPSSATVLPQEKIQFQAKVYSQNGILLDKQVVWSTENGSITSAGLYTAPEIINPKTISVTASVDNVSRSINLRLVNEKTEKDNRYYFYADELPDLQNLKFDTANPDDINGGYLGTLSYTKISVTYDDIYEGSSALKVEIDNAPKYEGGIYFQFGYLSKNKQPIRITDLSNYNTLKFAFKTKLNVTSFNIRIKTANSDYDFPINIENYTTWGMVELNIPNNLSVLKQFKQLLFMTDANTFGEFFLDNIYFEKK